MSISLNDKKRNLIERIGIAYEKKGFQPVAGRIIGLLYVSPRPELTFDEIRETLGISKSATSNSLNLLMQINWIEYTTFSGDRKRYFRLTVGNWRERVMKDIEKIVELNGLLQEVVKVRDDSSERFSSCVAEFADFLQYINEEMPHLMERWENQRKKV